MKRGYLSAILMGVVFGVVVGYLFLFLLKLAYGITGFSGLDVGGPSVQHSLTLLKFAIAFGCVAAVMQYYWLKKKNKWPMDDDNHNE